MYKIKQNKKTNILNFSGRLNKKRWCSDRTLPVVLDGIHEMGAAIAEW
ncbi:MAG: hypothetical protein ACE5HX_13440 [bacterium]